MKHFVPSWQKPGTWLENIIALAPVERIDGIELLFFEWNDDVRSSLARELPEIQAFSHRFEFSIHLPDPLETSAIELVGLTQSFVQRYIFHPPCIEGRPDAERPSPHAAIDSLPISPAADSITGTVSLLRDRFGADRFLMEFTGEPSFSQARDVLPGISFCADTGCLLRMNLDPAEWISRNAASIKEIHLHGFRDGRDHLPLDSTEPWLPDLARFCMERNIDIVHELFSLDATSESHNVFRRFLP